MLKKAKKEAKENGNSVEDTIRSIQTKFGEGAIMKLGDSPKVDIDVIPTGSIGLDMALGIGGVPRGRIIEIFGPESSGKTTLALHIVAEAQKKGGVCAYIDAEHAMDPDYASKLGVNIKNLLISQPDNGEQGLEITESLVRSGKIDVIVIDSVAALTPRDEIEGDMGQSHVGKQARLMSQALRKLTAIVARSKTVVIFVNQIRMQIGIMFGNPETTPGGKALKFYTSIRLDIRRIAQIKKGEEVSLPGLQARLMSQALRKLTASVSKSKTMVIFINQIRMKIGVMYGSPETTTGGNALKFYASVRLDIRRVGSIKDRDEVIGNETRVKVVKNKVAPPFRQVDFDIIYGEGISKTGELIDLGVKGNIIEKSGSWFSYGSQRIGQGRENARKFLKENPATAAEIEDAIRRNSGVLGETLLVEGKEEEDEE